MTEETTIVEETIAQEEPQVEETQANDEPIDNRTPEQKESDRIKAKAAKTRARIEELSADKLAERRRADALERQLEELRREKETSQPSHNKQSSNGQPNADDFPAGRYDPDYLIAIAKYEIQQSIDNLQKSATVKEQRNLVELQQDQARQRYNDYDDATAELLDHPLANDASFNEAILNSDNVAEIAYYLGKNPDELDAIAALSGNPAKMLKYIGRIEARLESQPTLVQPKKAVSNAPKPVSPVGSAKPEPASKDPSNMTQSEYIAWRQGQKRT